VIMHPKGKIILIGVVFVLVALPCLASCTAKSNTIEPPVFSLDTVSPSITPTTISSTTMHTSTSTAIPPSIVALSTESLFPIPNGRVLFVRDSNRNDNNSNGLVLLNINTKESILIVQKNLELNSQTLLLSNPSLTWSPDGHSIAFVAVNTDNNFFWYAQEDVYLVRSDGTDLRRLTNSPRYNKWDIEWSPDGQHLLVAMGINGSDLYLIDAVNGEIVKRLTSSGKDYTAAWSSYGDKIAYLEESALFVMDVTDKTSQLINIPANHHVLGISWSPDDGQIALVSSVDNSKCADIFITNIDTGELTNLTSSKYFEISADWLPNGNNLVFLRSAVTCDEMDGKRDWDIHITNLVGENHKIVSGTGSETIIAWAPVPNLETGKQYIITELGENINLRTEPSLSGKIIEKLPAGEVITVLEGFVDTENYYWWKMKTQNDREGWAVEVANWYQPVNP